MKKSYIARGVKEGLLCSEGTLGTSDAYQDPG